MAERRSPLADLVSASGKEAETALSEVRPASVMQVAAWPQTLGTVERALAEMLGVAAPRIGTAASDPNLTIAAIAPGRFLLTAAAPDLTARLQSGLPAGEATVTDLAHGRAILRLEGPAAAATLGRCVAIDLHPDAFPPGRIAQTAIHHVDVMLHRVAATAFHVWVLRGFAESLAEWILDAGHDLGVGFQSGAASRR